MTHCIYAIDVDNFALGQRQHTRHGDFNNAFVHSDEDAFFGKKVSTAVS